MKSLWGIFAVSALAVMTMATDALAGSAAVTQVQGDVVVNRRNHDLAVFNGMELIEGDEIEVGVDSSVDITINNLIGWRLMAETQGRIDSLRENRIKVSAEEGSILVNSEPLPGNTAFTVTTPVAVTGIRGTRFWGRVVTVDNITGEIEGTFAVGAGKIWLRLRGSETELELSEGAAVDLSSEVSPQFRPALKEELAALKTAAGIKTRIG